MPFIEGVGDDVIYAALFAAPIIIFFRSSLGLHSFDYLKQGVYIIWNRVSGIWNTMWGRRTTASVPASEGRGGYLAHILVPPENDCCSICHDAFTLPCQANCAHWFCGDCILGVWQHTSALQPCKCPICRRPINLLIPSDFAPRNDPEAQRVLQQISNYNRLHGGGSVGILQRLRDMPLLLRRMLQDLMDPQRALPFVNRTRVIVYLLLMAFYVLSPLDILPEGILGLVGLMDDFLVMILVLFHLAAMYRTALVYRYGFRG